MLHLDKLRPPQKPERFKLWLAGLVVIIGFLSTFLSRGIGDSYMVFLVALEGEFGWSRTALTGVYSVYMLATGFSAPFWGYCFDRFGPRATYVSGMLILGIDMLLASLSTSLWHFYITTGVLAGVASSALGMVPASNLISRWFSARRATVIAIAHAGFGLGLMVMLPLAQLSIDTAGWRHTYITMGAGLLILLPVVLVLPWRHLAAGSSAAMPSTAVATLFAPVSSGSGTRMRTSHGPTILQALATREFWLLVQVLFFTAAGMYGVLVQTVAYLVDLGLSPLRAAAIFGTSAMLSVIGVIASGIVCDLYGHRLTATVSFCGTALGIVALLAFSYETVTWFLLVYMFLFGLSQGARGPIVSTLTTRIFSGSSLGAIYGAIFLLMSVGAAAGAFGAGLLHDLTGSYRPTFILSIICIAVAAAPFWLSRRLGSHVWNLTDR